MRSTSRPGSRTTAGAARPAPFGPRFRFFGGKGGVGKTTLSAAHALAAAETGRRVLVVSTDPAHSLGDALALPLGAAPRRVPTRRGRLEAAELDAEAALARWRAPRDAVLAEIALRGTYLDREDVSRLLGLSLPGVDELIGLLELARLAAAGGHDEVVVDTAPTGHTLRLLEMPRTLAQIAAVLDDMQSKHRFLGRSLGGGHRADAADALIEELEGEAAALAGRLRDPARAVFSWVLLPEALALEEAKDGVAALDEAGMRVDEVVVNRLTPPPPGRCALCAARRAAEGAALAAIEAEFGSRRRRLVAGAEEEPRGTAALRRLAASGPPAPARRGGARAPRRVRSGGARRPAAGAPWWLDPLARPSVRLLLFGGKGGVGKTSAAAATALALARAGRPDVLLLSADPAHSLADVLGQPLGDDEQAVRGSARLVARELDAERALAQARAKYRAAVDELFDALRGRSRLDPAFDRAVVQDLIELAPPGIDEVFALVAVTDALVSKAAQGRTVVLDTAPTGHALRLLALPRAAREWVQALLALLLKYREVVSLGALAQDLVTMARQLRGLESLLRDPARTSFVAVTRPADLPRRETERLLDELRALEVPAGALLVNALTPPGCARCRRAAAREAREVARIRRRWRSLTGGERPMILAPMMAPPPRGPFALRSWGEAWRPDAPARGPRPRAR